MLKQLLVITVILAICLVNNCDAIKCYTCKSITDAACANEVIEPSHNVKQIDCEHAPKPSFVGTLLPVTKCNIVVTKDRAGTITSRDCHFEEVGQDSKTCKVSHSQSIESCKICEGDLCNSPAGRIASMGAVALFAMVAVALRL